MRHPFRNLLLLLAVVALAGLVAGARGKIDQPEMADLAVSVAPELTQDQRNEVGTVDICTEAEPAAPECNADGTYPDDAPAMVLTAEIPSDLYKEVKGKECGQKTQDKLSSKLLTVTSAPTAVPGVAQFNTTLLSIQGKDVDPGRYCGLITVARKDAAGKSAAALTIPIEVGIGDRGQPTVNSRIGLAVGGGGLIGFIVFWALPVLGPRRKVLALRTEVERMTQADHGEPSDLTLLPLRVEGGLHLAESSWDPAEVNAALEQLKALTDNRPRVAKFAMDTRSLRKAADGLDRLKDRAELVDLRHRMVRTHTEFEKLLQRRAQADPDWTKTVPAHGVDLADQISAAIIQFDDSGTTTDLEHALPEDVAMLQEGAGTGEVGLALRDAEDHDPAKWLNRNLGVVIGVVTFVLISVVVVFEHFLNDATFEASGRQTLRLAIYAFGAQLTGGGLGDLYKKLTG